MDVIPTWPSAQKGEAEHQIQYASSATALSTIRSDAGISCADHCAQPSQANESLQEGHVSNVGDDELL